MSDPSPRNGDGSMALEVETDNRFTIEDPEGADGIDVLASEAPPAADNPFAVSS